MINLTGTTRVERSVPLAALTASPFNPAGRTKKDAKFRLLREDIERNGQLSRVHLVLMDDGGFAIADGHRRVDVLRDLGCKTVDATVWGDGSGWKALVRVLYVAENIGKKQLSDRQQVEAALAGGPVFSARVESTVSFYAAMYGGKTKVPDNIGGAAGTYLLGVAKRVTRFCWPSVKPKTADGEWAERFISHVREVLAWLVETNTQANAIVYMRHQYSSDRLREAIEKNRGVPLFLPRGVKVVRIVEGDDRPAAKRST